MKWQNVAASLAARKLVRLVVRYGIPAIAGAVAAVLAEAPEAVQQAVLKLCGSF